MQPVLLRNNNFHCESQLEVSEEIFYQGFPALNSLFVRIGQLSAQSNDKVSQSYLHRLG